LLYQLSAVNTPVCLVQSGSKALAELRAAAQRNNGFGLAIVDASLPNVNGAELGCRIKGTLATRVIVLTSLDQDVEKLDNNGISRLTKPIRQSALWDCLTGEYAEAGLLAPEARPWAAPNRPNPGKARVLLVGRQSRQYGSRCCDPRKHGVHGRNRGERVARPRSPFNRRVA
jgi:CheY-like chemotaxis protein